MEKITKKTVEKMNQQLLEVHEKRMKNKLNAHLDDKKFILLNDSMLRKKKYDIEVLEKNIYNLSMKTLLYTQYLTADFCIKYILNEKYASCVEDTFLSMGDILNAQKHITRSSIYHAYNKVYCEKDKT
jgi:phenylalanyl-tRNA synthetase alpha subunit